MLKFFSDSFKSGFKRQLVLKGLDLLIEALADFKSSYASRTQTQTQSLPETTLKGHL